MKEKLETARLLLGAAWMVISTVYRIYADAVNALGQPWSMMIHSTVWGMVGGLLVKLVWHDAVMGF